MKIKKGDVVAVIAGSKEDKYNIDKKGVKTLKTGQVIKVYPKEDTVVVQGVNIVKKHQRPTQQNEKGTILDVEAPIHVSNVAIIDPKDHRPAKIGYKVVNGKKVRFSKRTGELLDKVDKKADNKKAESKEKAAEKPAKEKKAVVAEKPAEKPAKEKKAVANEKPAEKPAKEKTSKKKSEVAE